jgi:RNA polymerase sigma-70 factor (ECF subfamily)
LARFVDERGGERQPDLVLACACLDGDSRAIGLFEREILAPVAARLAGAGMGSGVAEEAIGRLREALFVAPEGGRPKLAAYSGRGALRGWFEVIATRELYKISRSEPQALSDDHILALLPADDDLELRHIKAQHRAELKSAFGEALGGLSFHERLILRQRYLDGLTLDEVGAVQGIHRITVMRQLAKIERKRLLEIVEHWKGDAHARPPQWARLGSAAVGTP